MPAQPRRTPVLSAVAAGLLVAPLALAGLGLLPSAASVCGPGAEVLDGLPGPVVCVHSDEAPPGVDVTDPVPVRELQARQGAGEAAYAAAEELGVPSTPAAAAPGPAVPCDGDGTSGHRIQAMYVVEVGRANRFADLEQSMKVWAAGVDDVVNRSAALTGGVRHLRYVTEPGPDGTCSADVLNVTVPAGSMTSFSATISAVQALGYTDARRKYLMWTDASVLCGVATMYPNDSDSQANPNNGAYAQYARVDTGCWGLGDGAAQHSVEAHELVHTLGGVQSTAPHGTRAGHCWDESDTMCYADGGGFAMRQVCPPEREYLLDCNTDDYFSTYPDPGSYLDSHWNAADSRFLIGGGDGTGGGSAGAPTVLGATIGANNPVVPGLSTQVSVTPVLPAGRSLASVTWKAGRADCSFGTPTGLQSTVTCAASATGYTTVTATLVDSTGATKAVSSPLTFAPPTGRPVEVRLAVAAQDADPASVCSGAAFPVTATVLDVASGQPVKGLPVSFTKKTPTMTAPGSAGAALTSVTGAATAGGTATVSTVYAARTAASPAYAAGASAALTAAPAICAPVLTGEKPVDALYRGERLTVSGTLTRDAGGLTVPVAGASLPVRLTAVAGGVTKVLSLGTARTGADGSYALSVLPTVSGTVSVTLPASTAYRATTADLGSLAVHLPVTDLTADVDRTDVGYGDAVVVSGRLTKTSGALTTGEVTAGVPAASLSVKVTPPGKAPVTVGAAKTAADGTFRVSLPLRYSGALSVVYAGAAGLPADSVAVGSVTAGTWDPALTLRGAVSGSALQLTGTVSRTYAGTTSTTSGLRVKVTFTAAGATAPVLVTSTTTSSNGGFSVKVYPRSSGSYRASISGVAGHRDATSDPVSAQIG